MQAGPPKEEREIFVRALEALNRAGVPYVVGGAYAMFYYTGIYRHTKDIDLFMLPRDVDVALVLLRNIGYHTRVEAENWLAKAFMRDYMIDLIFGEGNWLHHVDEDWFSRSLAGQVLGVNALIAPIEELILSKAYVAERGRYDGADIMHLFQASRGKLDWQHLLDRFTGQWQLLFSYLNLFLYVYPSLKGYVPKWVINEMILRLQQEMEKPAPREKICRGTLLDRLSYIHDVEELGYHDPREELAKRLGYSVKDVIAERRWAARKVHQRESHAA